jgi:hypothetical protein
MKGKERKRKGKRKREWKKGNSRENKLFVFL